MVITFTPVGARALVHVEPPVAGLQVPGDVPMQPGCGDWRGNLRADFSNPARIRIDGRYGAACGERIWPIASGQPATFAARAIRGMWQHIGGSLLGQMRDGKVPAGLQPAFEIASPPLAEVIRDINKYSNNVMAQQVFLTLALQRGTPATLDTAREVLKAWWRDRVGGDVPAFQNGSGLARDERITAGQLARLLQLAWSSPLMPDFIASLPISGIDGTLRRGLGPGTAGIAHLKTGTLRDVRGAAGYVDGPNGKRYVVVAIANGPDAGTAQPVIDALIAWAAQGE